jgi:hypothetical protein
MATGRRLVMRMAVPKDRRGAHAALAALTAFAVEISAIAAPPVCMPGIPDLSGCCYTKPNPVFVAGTSAARSALQAVARSLPGVTIVYQTPDSCVALAALTAGAATGGGNVTTSILGADGSVVPCALSPGYENDPEQAVNIAVSDIFPATCQTNVGSGGITAGKQVDVLGPIQAQTIVVPSGASPDSISAEAAYVVFGYGATQPYVLPPWTEPTSIFIRPYTSGTLNIIGTAIGLPGAKWKNAMSSVLPQVEATSAAMYTAVANASSGPDASSPVDSTIGILAAQFVEQSNAGVVLDGGGGGTIKALAFQQKGQSCGYYPDSVASSADKLNVRQGRYAIWGPAHLVANVGADGNPNGLHAAAVAAVLNAFIATGCEGAACPPGSNSLLGASETYFGVDGGTSGPTDAIKQAVIDAEAAGGVVPWCAMQVTRGNIEIGAEASYQPSEPCGCRFESQVPGATVSAYCHACVVDGDCQAEGAKASYPKCRYGFCEVQ